jgi:hypothetical protein
MVIVSCLLNVKDIWMEEKVITSVTRRRRMTKLPFPCAGNKNVLACLTMVVASASRNEMTDALTWRHSSTAGVGRHFAVCLQYITTFK